MSAGAQGAQSTSIHGVGVSVSAPGALSVGALLCRVLVLELGCCLCSWYCVCGCAGCSECWVLLMVFAVSFSSCSNCAGSSVEDGSSWRMF